jgi:hypothetical protein
LAGASQITGMSQVLRDMWITCGCMSGEMFAVIKLAKESASKVFAECRSNLLLCLIACGAVHDT